jgi:ferredoxin, 2Fe-2S
VLVAFFAMAKITIAGASERTFEVAPGTSLLRALQEGGHPISTSCGGVATCALCRVTVTAGKEHLSPLVESEINHLGNVAKIVGLRLACQAKITGTGDVRVDVPEVEDVAARKAAKAARMRQRR